EEENVGPSAMREVKPDRRALQQNRKQPFRRRTREERLMKAQRVLVGAAYPKHPAVALAAPDRVPHLVGQVLEGDLFVYLRECAADRSPGPLALHRLAKQRDRLLVTPFHQVHETGEWDLSRSPNSRIILDLETIQGMQKQRGAHPLVEVFPALPESLDLF